MKRNSFSGDFVIGLLLFCVFTGAMLMALVSGAGAYKDISAEMEAQYSERTCVSYITAKLRHFDSLGAISVGKIQGMDVIMLTEEENGTECITYIYYYDGYVRELYCEKDMDFDPEAGLSVISAEALSAEEPEDNLIKIECVSGGRSVSAYVALSSGREVS